ncbi:MAG: MazG nucleotide pyrophosphohydrolase domain-containing protein, partial [Fidelibacterota bacterium]
QEEILEVKEAQINGSADQLEEEIGDVLFSIVNLARFLKISAEDALRKTNAKFIRRFKAVEQELKSRGRDIQEASLEEMDAIWNQVKGK